MINRIKPLFLFVSLWVVWASDAHASSIGMVPAVDAPTQFVGENQENTVVELVDTASPTSSAGQRLLDQLNTLQDLNASFVQTVRDAKGVVVDESRGRFLWKRPRLFRWDIEQPFAQSIVIKNDEQYQYDADLEQLTIQPLDSNAATLPNILLASDETALNKNYRVRTIERRAATEFGDAGSSELFSISPRQVNAELETILLEFKRGALVSIDIVDSLQQTSRFELSPNGGDALSADDFEIVTAPGTVIVRP